MAQISGIQIGTFIRTAAAASMLALAVVTVPASEAHAIPIGREAPGGGGSKTCTDPDGNQVAGGTVWTSYTQNGQVASKYKCNGKTGQWDKMAGPPAPSTSHRVPKGGVYKP